MKYQGSNFVTPVGLVILFILVLIAAFFSITGLEALLVAVLLLSLAAFFWSRSSLKDISILPSNPQIRAFPGTSMETEMTLKNEKHLPLTWLETELPLNSSCCIAPAREGETALKCRFHWIMPRQSVIWNQTVAAKQRGAVIFDSIHITSGDGFGLCSATKTVQLSRPVEFIVYPKIHGVTLAPILSRLREMEIQKNGYYRDPTLIRSIRDYQPGDNMRNINWRQLARSGILSVNVHESMGMNRFCLIPDLSSCCYQALEKQGDIEKVVTKVREEQLEDMLSLLASIIAAAHDQQLNCSLVIPGYGNTTTRIIIPESRESQVPQLLTALARIDYRGQQTYFPEPAMEEQRHLLGSCFLFSRKLQTDAINFPHTAVLTEQAIRSDGDFINGKEFCP